MLVVIGELASTLHQVHFNVINRKVHHWASFIVAVPILVIIASGILLQMKKQWTWVQPAEQRGVGRIPIVSFDHILSSMRGVEPLNVMSWDDVDRLDVRPGRGVVKVTLKNRWEAQIDLETGRLLQTAYRRSDLIESIHDGSVFAGDWTKLGIFLPAGLTLLLLWLTGVWMVWVQFIGKHRRKKMLHKRAAVILFALSLTTGAYAQGGRLAVDTIVGHWEGTTEQGEAVVVSDTRKWKSDKATTPFPVAAVRGIERFSNGVLSVKFKMVGGESDQIAGLAFAIAPDGTYYYARYNTKDGNVAIWQFVNGDRKRVADGVDHVQLPLNTWHDLRVEISGKNITASVNGKLRVEHTLPQPVSGRVGFWTKRDSITAFKGFTAVPAQ